MIRELFCLFSISFLCVQGDAVRCIFGLEETGIQGEFKCVISNEAAIAIITGIAFVVLAFTCLCCFKAYESHHGGKNYTCICCSKGYSPVPREEKNVPCYEVVYK